MQQELARSDWLPILVLLFSMFWLPASIVFLEVTDWLNWRRVYGPYVREGRKTGIWNPKLIKH